MTQTLRQRALLPILSTILALPLLLNMLSIAGCGHNAVVSHPGAINSFDSTTADTLATAKVSIEKAKTLYTSPAQKVILNKVIAAWNLADDSYLAYHAALVAGGAPDAVTLQNLLTQLAVDLVTIKGPPSTP